MLKRLLVTILAVAVACTAGLTAFAAPGDLGGPAFRDIAGHPAEADLTGLGALGVFAGSEGLGGPVNPNDPINREQYCKVVVAASGLSSLADSLYNVRPERFTDHAQISRWVWGYVNAAVHQRIIQGYDDGTFKPQRPVTYAEALVMLIRSVRGHESLIDSSLPWPMGVLFYGIPAGFAGSVTFSDPNASCTRGDMARMLLATMRVCPLKPDGTPDPAGPMLKEGNRLFSGRFLGRTGDNIFLDTYPGPIALGDPVFIVGASSYESCVGNEVVCIAKADRKVVAIRLLAGSSSTGVFQEKGSDAGGTYILLQDGRKLYYSGDVPVVLNNDTSTPNTQDHLWSGDELIFNLDADGKVVAITAKRFDLVRRKLVLLPPLPTLYLVAGEDYLAGVTASTSMTPTQLTFNDVTGYFYYHMSTSSWKPLKDAVLEVGSSAVVKINGVPSNRNSLAADDVIKVATFGAKGYNGAASIIEIAANRATIEGTVVTNITQVTTEGTRYFVRLNVAGTNHDIERNVVYLPMEPTVGDQFKFSRDFSGRLFHMISYGLSYYDVFVKGGSTSGSSHTVTVDNRGTETTYTCAGAPGPFVGLFCRIWVKEGVNEVIAIWPVTFPEFLAGTVAAASASNVTIQVGGTTYFDTNDQVVVYRKTGPTSFAYIGCSGLISGNSIKTFLSGTDIIFIYVEP